MIKKQLIMEKALELFAENGIEATSIQQITERCGISKGAFYLSYKSKNELVHDLIDYFMSEITANIERAVNSKEHNQDFLYNFYYTTFKATQKYSDFAKIFMKEHVTSFDLEILKLLKKYDEFMTSFIFSLVDRQFPKIDAIMRADLVYSIKGFIKHYSELFLIYQCPINLHEFCRALVEKTTILAEHATLPIITLDFLSSKNSECLSPTKEQLMNLLSHKINESSDPIIQHSLELLKDDLNEPQLHPALIQGLLKNLRSDSYCKWTAYLYELYLKQL